MLAARYGWDVVEEYLERQESGGETSWRSIADFFTATKSVKMTHTFVGTTLRRWQENGDPAHIGTGGDTSRRASTDERVWIKTLLRSQPDLYFFEVTEKFVKEFTWRISHKMISAALHFAGEGADDHQGSAHPVDAAGNIGRVSCVKHGWAQQSTQL